jgi:hypothetical protein
MISALPALFEVVGAFLGCEGSQEFTDCCANGFDCRAAGAIPFGIIEPRARR